MAGMFDDLIPQQPAAQPAGGGGMFDDLIPKKTGAGDPNFIIPAPGGMDAAFQQFKAQPARPEADVTRMQDLASAYRVAQPGRGPAVDQRVQKLGKDTNPYLNATWQGMTFGFGDEIGAGIRTGFGQGNGYNENLAVERELLRRQRQERPVGMAGAEVVGALTTPTGAAGAAATVGGRALQAAKQGAIFGGLYGVGTGEGVTDRIQQGATGATVGAALGGVASPVIDAAVAGGKAAAGAVAPLFRTTQGIDDEAARRVGVALQRDAVDPAQAAAQLRTDVSVGTPSVVADFGGETTRGLARSAANTSPEAREALVNVAQPRFESQGDRTVDAVRRATGANGDVALTREALEDAARRANKPAYDRAYAQGQTVWNRELSDITSAPAVQSAIKDATTRSRNVAATEGARPVKNPFNVDEATGAVSLKPGMTPSLQFWDVVKRNLDSQAGKLKRAGDESGAREIGNLTRTLVGHLDNSVPTYKAARQGAAKFFGAENALEAGEKFVTSTMENGVASRALGRMSKPEQDLFREGFSSALIARVRELRDSRDVVNAIFGSSAARERIKIALGSERARNLEAFIRSEQTMDLLRKAVSGNSTSVRQLAELGLAGGVGLASGAVSGNLLSPEALVTGALVYGIRRRGLNVDGRVAKRVGEMLASQDPGVFAKGVDAIARDSRLMSAIQEATKFLTGGVARPSAGTANVQTMLPGRASEDEQN